MIFTAIAPQLPALDRKEQLEAAEKDSNRIEDCEQTFDIRCETGAGGHVLSCARVLAARENHSGLGTLAVGFARWA